MENNRKEKSSIKILNKKWGVILFIFILMPIIINLALEINKIIEMKKEYEDTRLSKYEKITPGTYKAGIAVFEGQVIKGNSIKNTLIQQIAEFNRLYDNHLIQIEYNDKIYVLNEIEKVKEQIKDENYYSIKCLYDEDEWVYQVNIIENGENT